MCIVYIIVKYTLFTHHHNSNVIHASKTQITNLGVGWGGGGYTQVMNLSGYPLPNQ